MGYFGNNAGPIALSAMVCLLTATAVQAEDRRREHEFREPRFFDPRFHHDHYYPPLGFVFGALPPGFHLFIRNGINFYFAGGVWYRLDGRGRYVVVPAPVGVVMPSLPPDYTTLYVNGVPYYYANSTYYVQGPEGYAVASPPPSNVVVELPPQTTVSPPPPPLNAEAAQPPATVTAQAGSDPLFIYPRQGQSAGQQASDTSQCHSWATSQVGFDPDVTPGGQSGSSYQGYKRAMSACLDARGYTVR